jgi:DNA-binding HxlR family transcriptional regulator
MKRKPLGHMNCSIAQTLDVVGDPWTLLIVRDALFGTTRFDDFRRSLGIPRATLATRLDTLVDHGVMERRRYHERPERHEYVLTDKGRDLRRVMISLLQWGDRWSDLDPPPVTLIDLDTDEPIEPTYVDMRTGRPLGDLRVGRRFNG